MIVDAWRGGLMPSDQAARHLFLEKSLPMVMTLHPNGHGGLLVVQKLRKPVVYLDHWAIRLFCENRPLQDRFIAALHQSGGTWLFSQINLFEFVAMTDTEQARRAEALLLRAMPNLHVADLTMDKGYVFPDGAPQHPDAPQQHWILQDIGERAYIAGGHWNMHNFVADCINHSGELLPLFEEMKATMKTAIKELSQQAHLQANAKRFVPTKGMTLRDALARELLREAYVNPAYEFDEHDAVDFIHAFGPATVCDFILLDIRWCHRFEHAARRLHKGGVKGKLPKPYSRRTVAAFLADLEALAIKPPA
jgi:hypothetical protein